MRKVIEKHHLMENKCLIMLILFLVWFATSPLALTNQRMIMAYIIGYLILMVGGAYVIIGNRWLFICSTVLAIYVSTQWISHISTPSHAMRELCGVMVVTFDFIMTTAMIFNTLLARKFKRDMLFGVIFTFFMIGESFGHAFYVLQFWDLVRFNVVDMPQGMTGILDCVYFSFTSLTTTGYGDIVPVTVFAKRMTSLEQSVGVLYVAVFIGRLMNIYGIDHLSKQAK